MKVFGFRKRYFMKKESLIDITPDVEKEVEKSGIKEGIVVVFSKGSTSGITTIEYEEGLKKDLFEAMENIAPSDKNYFHNLKWGDGNGKSHVRSSVVGCSITIPITDGELDLGTWQQIVLINFDIRDREREVIGKIIGI